MNRFSGIQTGSRLRRMRVSILSKNAAKLTKPCVESRKFKSLPGIDSTRENAPELVLLLLLSEQGDFIFVACEKTIDVFMVC